MSLLLSIILVIEQLARKEENKMSVRATIMALAIAVTAAIAAFGLYIIIPVLAAIIIKAILTVPLSVWELVGSIALLVVSIKVNLYL